MNNKCKKSIIAIIFFLSVFIECNITAFADPFTDIAIGVGGLSGAGLFGSMALSSGVDISYNSDPVNDAIWNSLNPENVYFSGETHEQETIHETVYDYITVDIGDWLSAQNDFIDEFVSTYNVGDDDSGTITSPANNSGYPALMYHGATYYWGPQLATLHVGATATVGSNMLIVDSETETKFNIKTYLNGTLDYTAQVNKTKAGLPIVFGVKTTSFTQPKWGYIENNDFVNITTARNTTVTQESSVSWESSEVDTSVFDDYSAVNVMIPHSISNLQIGFTLADFIDALNSIWENGLQSQILIEDDQDPPPPPPPLPSTPLGEVPYDEWVDTWGQTVITNQETGNDSLDNIDTNIQTGVDTLDSIDTNIGTTNGILGQIKDLIQSGFNSITSLLNQILTGVQALVNSIVNATETLIAGILNQIPIAFQTAWNTLKQHVSIWHYVVEWVTSITAPFTWIWGIASGTSYYIILPVYASLAGAVVLALYKKFGR